MPVVEPVLQRDNGGGQAPVPGVAGPADRTPPRLAADGRFPGQGEQAAAARRSSPARTRRPTPRSSTAPRSPSGTRAAALPCSLERRSGVQTRPERRRAATRLARVMADALSSPSGACTGGRWAGHRRAEVRRRDRRGGRSRSSSATRAAGRCRPGKPEEDKRLRVHRRHRHARVRPCSLPDQPRVAQPADASQTRWHRSGTGCAAARPSARAASSCTPVRPCPSRATTALRQVHEHLLPLLDEIPDDGPDLLLEPMAGQGAMLCATVQDLGPYLDALDRHPRAGVCLDTCHAFAAGHDLAAPGGVAATLDALADISRRGTAQADPRQRLQGRLRLGQGPAREHRSRPHRRRAVRRAVPAPGEPRRADGDRDARPQRRPAPRRHRHAQGRARLTGKRTLTPARSPAPEPPVGRRAVSSGLRLPGASGALPRPSRTARVLSRPAGGIRHLGPGRMGRTAGHRSPLLIRHERPRNGKGLGAAEQPPDRSAAPRRRRLASTPPSRSLAAVPRTLLCRNPRVRADLTAKPIKALASVNGL